MTQGVQKEVAEKYKLGIAFRIIDHRMVKSNGRSVKLIKKVDLSHISLNKIK